MWAFGDSYVLGIGGQEWSSTAALANPSSPMSLTEPVVGDPARYLSPMVSPTVEDLAWVAADPADRMAKYWPASIIPEVGNNSAVVYSNHLRAENVTTPEGTEWVLSNTGLNLGHLTAGGDTTTDHVAEFTNDVRKFHHGIFLDTSVSPLSQYVYLYDCPTASAGDVLGGTLPLCKVGRVLRTAMTTMSSYEFWNGTTWVSDVAAAVPTVPGSSGGFDVQWNDHLESYISIVPRTKINWNDLNGDGQITEDEIASSYHVIELRRASSPVAPAEQWTEPIVLCGTTTAAFDACEWTIGDLASNGVPYAWRIHPALSATDGSTIAVTYYQPTATPTDWFRGEVRVLDVTLG